MGTLYRRPDARAWFASWIDGRGRRRRASTRTGDRRVAALWLAAREGEAVREGAGAPVAHPVALADAVGEYLDSRAPPTWSPEWHRTCRYWFKARIQPRLGGAERPVRDVTSADAENAREAWLREDGLQGPTVNRLTAVAGAFWRWAMAPGRRYALENPWRGHRRFRERKAEPPPLTPADLDRWLAAIPNPEIRRLATVRLETSKRPGELRRVRWADVRPDAALMRVRVGKPPPGQSPRETWVPLPPRSLRAVLEQHAAAGDDLFSRAPRNVRKSLDAAHRVSGVPRFRWYDLRHYALTEAADAGAMPHDLQEMAGWLSPAQAARYVHPSVERVRQVQLRRLAGRDAGGTEPGVTVRNPDTP